MHFSQTACPKSCSRPSPHFVTKLEGTSKGAMVVAIQKELGLPIKFVGLGEQPDDLQPFDAKQFAQALFEE